jgi:hypothetical protein
VVAQCKVLGMLVNKLQIDKGSKFDTMSSGGRTPTTWKASPTAPGCGRTETLVVPVRYRSPGGVEVHEQGAPRHSREGGVYRSKAVSAAPCGADVCVARKGGPSVAARISLITFSCSS